MKLVYVKWRDATLHPGHYDRRECKHLKPVTMESAGILVRLGRKFITLAIDSIRVDGAHREVQQIPLVNVLEVRTVKVGRMTRLDI